MPTSWLTRASAPIVPASAITGLPCFFALRATRDFGAQDLGGMVSHVERPFLDRQATVYSADHLWTPSAAWSIRSQVVASSIRQAGATANDSGMQVRADHEMGDGWRQQQGERARDSCDREEDVGAVFAIRPREGGREHYQAAADQESRRCHDELEQRIAPQCLATVEPRGDSAAHCAADTQPTHERGGDRTDRRCRVAEMESQQTRPRDFVREPGKA